MPNPHDTALLRRYHEQGDLAIMSSASFRLMCS